MGFDGIDEMLGVGFGEVLDAEVVDTKDEGCAFGAMSPEAGGEGHGFVAVGRELFDELVEGDDTSFFEAAHASADFETHVAVVGDVRTSCRASSHASCGMTESGTRMCWKQVIGGPR